MATLAPPARDGETPASGGGRRLPALLALLALAGCARIQAPPGGPPDARPPRVQLEAPPPGSLGLSGRPDFSLRFDEYMDRASVRSALSLNPRPEGDLELRWRGRRLSVRPSRDLAADRTWTLELGTGARDLAGNHLLDPLRVPFATGGRLDTLGLDLSLVPVDGGGRAEFWLWPWEQRPGRRIGRAPWRASPGPDGRARLSGLAEGRWFALAVEDLDGDGWWDPRRERAALPSRALCAPDSLSREPALFRLARLGGPDTLSLEGGRFIDRERLELTAWLEPPELASLPDTLREGPAADSLRLSCLDLADAAGRRPRLAGIARSGEGWRLFLGEPADSLPHVLTLREGADSLRLRPPPASWDGVLVAERELGRAWTGGRLRLAAGHAVQVGSEAPRQVAGSDTLSVPVRRRSATDLELAPPRGGGLLLVPRAFLAAGGRVWPDSLLTLPVPAAVATATGGVQWAWNRVPRESGWRLVLRHANGDRDLGMAYAGTADDLPEGLLSFALYLDRDRTGTWSPGGLDGPPAEPWTALPDTVQVLPGWIQGDVHLKLPEWIP